MKKNLVCQSLFVVLLLFSSLFSRAQTPSFDTERSIEKIEIEYKGKRKKGRKITVQTLMPVTKDSLWKALTPNNTVHIAKPMAYITILNKDNLVQWKQGDTYLLRALSYGILPIGGKHTIYIEEINPAESFIQTREFNSIAKIWDHKLSCTTVNENQSIYEDEIELYAGALTPLFALYLRKFYTHRQRRLRKLVGG